jgi:glutamine amidotransferase
MGNLNSVKRKLYRIGCDAHISSNYQDIISADKIILPGVGHFNKAMDYLKELNIIDALNNYVLVKKKPILGICLGMQLMANSSEEGNVKGLGWFDADVIRFNVKDTLKYKVPHVGWNQITNTKQSALMQGIENNSEFYFIHSYHMSLNNKSDMLHETEYEYNFASAIEKDNIFGVQYHPEKSHEIGEKLLKNFIDL